LGPSGCGKSTLLRLIAGLDQPDSGEVLVNDQPVYKPGKDRGMVFQKYTSFPWLTVADNIAYGLKINGVAAEKRRDTVAQLVQAVGLAGFEQSYPETLSGGMQQRVAIARTLALRPSVILMDEPFGALDAQTRSEMQQLLLRVWDETASTILFVTHDVEEAIYLADRVFIMSAHPGTIVEDVQVPFDRPRDLNLKQRNEFHELQNYVLGSLLPLMLAGGLELMYLAIVPQNYRFQRLVRSWKFAERQKQKQQRLGEMLRSLPAEMQSRYIHSAQVCNSVRANFTQLSSTSQIFLQQIDSRLQGLLSGYARLLVAAAQQQQY